MTVLGVDPGITHLGLGVVREEGKTFHFLHAEVVKTRADEPAPARVGRLYERLEETARRYGVEAIAVEEQFFYRQNELAFKVGWAMGAVFLVAHGLGVPVFGYGPMQVKRALVGHGHADKESVARMVARFLSLKEAPREDHATDALAIALTHLFHARLGPKPL
ncbi:crossover junction endodeoxyribonuclease RuvC [Thermus filiformis]|uniref:Crossover junction endodeoxyribonuclease RuvC n=1 Tax=Thermus filiformis TaxID=276 RepID=A0A0A2WSN4_THEFI|nr:crossover junction endodeoxyribonuclease RuvC [Thermus filiformis]KGQ21315.2 crossover junction endodeoxyribonuclease RuvC [Thermus filiformis]